MTKEAIIVDVDGTLADLTHRLHYIKDGNRDWESFFASVSTDMPIIDVCDFVDGFVAWSADYSDDFHVFVCSGRSDTCREDTESWLDAYVPNLWRQTEALLMREEGDHRPDVEVKRDMLNRIREQGFNVRWAIDDRKRVVDMWRAEGVTCFQCAPSDWDEGRRTFRDRPVLVMMVGPSGAGKSTLAQVLHKDVPGFDRFAHVSSDGMRQMVLGDWKDQSQNARVFSYCHGLTRLHLDHGTNVVFDATNIRAADRRALRDCAPRDALIVYLVVDRSLAKKRADGGWRNDVEVKGKPLIEQHQNTFYANMKDILRGDGDPRVRVVDCRLGDDWRVDRRAIQEALKGYVDTATEEERDGGLIDASERKGE